MGGRGRRSVRWGALLAAGLVAGLVAGCTDLPAPTPPARLTPPPPSTPAGPTALELGQQAGERE